MVMDNLKEFTDVVLGLTKEFSKAAGYKIETEKSILFLCPSTNN